MFGVIKTFILGNPWVTAGLVAGFLLYSGAIYGYGYKNASDHCVAQAVAHSDAAQAAQAKQDKGDQKKAADVGKQADADRKKSDKAAEPVIKVIHDTKVVVEDKCTITSEAIELLNKAGSL